MEDLIKEYCEKSKKDKNHLIGLMIDHEVKGIEVPMDLKIDFLVNCEICNTDLNSVDLSEVKHDDYNDMGYVENNAYNEFNNATIEHWVDSMIMPNGTRGRHWSLEDTTTVAISHGVKFEHITEYMWWATMNMMYSDYFEPTRNTEAYARLSKQFLFDADGKEPAEKLRCYYQYVAKH